MSAVSSSVTPRSSARWMVAVASAWSGVPYAKLMPMQPRPWAEVVSPERPRARVGKVMGLLVSADGGERSGTAHAAVGGDLEVDRVDGRLQLAEPDLHLIAVALEQREPLGLVARPLVDQPKVGLDVADGHGREPQPGDEHHPGQLGLGVPTPAGVVAGNVEQPDALVVAQRVGGDAGPLGGLGDGERLRPV